MGIKPLQERYVEYQVKLVEVVEGRKLMRTAKGGCDLECGQWEMWGRRLRGATVKNE